jgi:hypothetical protein
VRPAGHALNITSREQTQAKVRPTGAAATRISGYRRDNLRADIGVIDIDAMRSDSAIWVLLIRRRMLCSLRWVIPGLAEGVTGWLAGRG